jgi:hypothetical protein
MRRAVLRVPCHVQPHSTQTHLEDDWGLEQLPQRVCPAGLLFRLLASCCGSCRDGQHTAPACRKQLAPFAAAKHERLVLVLPQVVQ